MSGVIKEKDYKNLMCVNDVLLARVYIHPKNVIELEPDYKYPNVCHLKHRSGKWFHLRQTVLEVQKIYCESKRKLALEKESKGG